MNEEIKEQWIEALRSGEYKQGRTALHRVNLEDSLQPDEFCCLGVLCELAVKAGIIEAPHISAFRDKLTYAGQDNYLPIEVQKWAELDNNPSIVSKENLRGQPQTLAGLNDANFTFEEIAHVIEQEY